MNIYLVSRTDDWSYDEYDSMVVVAESADQAKLLNPRTGQYMTDEEWAERWANWTRSPDNLEVTLIGEASERSPEPRLILASYNAG